MMRDLLIITPTREREAGARRLIDAVGATVAARTDLVLAVDDDDRSYDSLDCRDSLNGGQVQVVRGPRQDVAGWTSKIALDRAGDYRFLASVGDDHVPRTYGWDSQLTGALGTRMGVAYGNDLYQGETWPTAVVISSPVVAALGYMAPPGPEHLYIDCFWKRLGEDLGCLAYLPDVIIEHLHPHAAKAPWDASYERSNNLGQDARDKAAYDRFLAEQWPADLARLKEKLSL